MMRPGRLHRRPAAPDTAKMAAPTALTTAAGLRPLINAPIAATERERAAVTAAQAIVAAEEVARQPESVQKAIRASVRARLRARGTTIAAAYAAHSAAVAGLSHDQHAAAAWRAAIVTAASLLRPAK